MRRVGGFAIGLLLSLPAASFAFEQPGHLDQQEEIQVASGLKARIQPHVGWETPSARAAEWQSFLVRHGGRWQAYWDLDRGVPARIFGEGVPVPGASGDPKIAEAAARTLLSGELPLIAPGTSIDDFEAVSNHLDAASGVRALGFVQRYRGTRVLGGQISVRIKNDRIIVIGSEAFPNVRVELPKAAPSASLRAKAERWIAGDFGSRTESRPAIEGPYVLPIVRSDGSITYHGVFQVTVDGRDPIGRWSVWLDALSGRPIARKQTLMFASGTVLFNSPERWPGATRLDQPAERAQLTVGTQNVTADAAGVFSFADGGPATVTAHARGTDVVVVNDSGPNASEQFTLDDGQSHVWDVSSDEMMDSQVIAFVATNHVKDWARLIAPDMTWLFTDHVPVTVNINDTCNAFSDGVGTNFFQASQQCENTGRLAGRRLSRVRPLAARPRDHRGRRRLRHLALRGRSRLSVGHHHRRPGMGRGFFYDDRPLRHLDPAQVEATWPDDIRRVHTRPA